MADVDVDRNLLFGVIALQDDLIDQAQFTDVCAGWAVRMQEPLADLLVERGWITPEDRREVVRKLERKLKKHGSDVRATSGAVAGADARDAIRAVEHPEVRKSLSGLPPAAGHVLVETMVKPTEERTRYTLTRLHAKGGLGRVWVARDHDLNREVALKEILPDQASHPEMWRRFLKEAQITGQLEHPNIVPVYELARRKEDDQPFYVMRFVRGRTLLDAIADHHRRRGQGPADPFELQKLLAAFTSVCQAIGYAHSRSIVHRDLKPENVMLGNFGEVIVLDWGLAKMVDRPDEAGDLPGIAITDEAKAEATLAGRQLGTPAYMAPEQAEGRLDLIDARTDIYGLGTILFEILTGRPPFEGTPAEVFRRIRTGPTPRALEVEPTVPRPLDEICARAMARVRADRYARATDLAEAVQRWIADAPRLAQANARVDGLAAAEVREVPGIIKELGDDRRLVRERLQEMARSDQTGPHGVRSRIHAALALLSEDPTQADTLADRLLQAESRPDELIVIRQALQDQGHAEPRTPALWALLNTTEAALTDPQFRAAGVLALFAPHDPRWSDLGRPMAEKLVHENPLLIGAWREVFQPVCGELVEPLRAIHGDRSHPEPRALASSLLFEFAIHPDNPHPTEDLVELIGEADPPLFRRILDTIPERARAVALLAAKLDRPARFDDVLARRQGQMATALALLGESERIWPWFKHTDDPSARTELIHDLARFGADPRPVIERLKTEPDVSARRALVLALGEYPTDQVPANDRQALVSMLLAWYRDDPDPGVHGGVDWLLRQKWDQARALDRIDAELSGVGLPEGRNRGRFARIVSRPKVRPDLPGARDWYVNGQGQTFAVVRGPVEFLMGSPEGEDDRMADEIPHRVRIGWSFAIATQPVTVVQYARFLDQNPSLLRMDKHETVTPHIPSPDCPIVGVDWYDAAKYCNWLSGREGIPEAQWCYPKEIGPGMTLPQDCLSHTGYRLPTEAEWEYACRAGSAASRYYGGSVAMLPKFAWYLENAGRQTHPTGQLKPNDQGLFDMLGNAYQWTQDPYNRYQTDQGDSPVMDEEVNIIISYEVVRVLRGGAFGVSAPLLRSARRLGVQPSLRVAYLGLRPARTYP